MKEKLKNSLIDLNTALEELSQNISFHDSLLHQQYSVNIHKYRDELSNAISKTQEQDSEVKKLNNTVISQQEKIARAETKLKDLIVSLKNKMEQL